MKRTSSTHPIDVGWVDSSTHGGVGRLGLTFAPGKCGRAPASGIEWERDLTLDLDRLRDHHGVDVLVSLMEAFEYDELRIPALLDEAQARGIETVHLPIADGQAPSRDQAAAVWQLLDTARGHLAAGRSVVIHCRGGQGRTGMMAAALLTTYGRAADAAIATVREVQPRAVESVVQQEYVESIAREHQRQNT